MPALTQSEINWILGNDTGHSSMTIWEVMTGQHLARQSTGRGLLPQDEADFGRCERLLEMFPDWRKRLGEVVMEHQHWRKIADDWSLLARYYHAGLSGEDTRAREHFVEHLGRCVG